MAQKKKFSSCNDVGESDGKSYLPKTDLYSVFEVDYDFYFKNNNGMFVVQTNI